MWSIAYDVSEYSLRNLAGGERFYGHQQSGLPGSTPEYLYLVELKWGEIVRYLSHGFASLGERKLISSIKSPLGSQLLSIEKEHSTASVLGQ